MNTHLIEYLLLVLVISAILFMVYRFWLRRSHLHLLNRVYLLSALFLSFLLPVINIPIYIESKIAVPDVSELPVIAGQFNDTQESMVASDVGSILPTLGSIIMWVILVGCLIALLRFCLQMLAIFRLKNHCKQVYLEGKKIYTSDKFTQPFSFAKNVFIPTAFFKRGTALDMMICHEETHGRLYHFIDVFIASFALIVGWWNPFFYLFKKELALLHEFEADAEVLHHFDADLYTKLLLSHTFGTGFSVCTHAFFHSPIKIRVMKFYQKNSASVWLRHIMVLPLFAVLCWVICVSFVPISKAESEKKMTFIVDAGHGGIDGGARKEGLVEKDLALQLALALESKAKGTQIEVVLTRNSDELPVANNKNESLRRRVEMVTQYEADALISIHVGTTVKANTYRGIDAFVSRDEKEMTENSKLFAATMLSSLQPGPLPVNMSIRQRKEEGLWVLDKSPKPAILLEVGYLSHKADASVLAQQENVQKLADLIFVGLQQYAAKQ